MIHRRRTDRAGRLRQSIAGLLALPLSVLPFVAYGTLTPEGRLVRDRAMVELFPPQLPVVSPAVRAAAADRAVPYRDGVMALAYHGIGSGSDGGRGGLVVSPERFGEHLVALRAAGMHAVTASEVARAFAGGRPLPPRAVMITFDDGRSDAMMFADPLLKQAGMKATMFVITEAASQPGVYYTPWSRLETYARSGRWDLQSHTASLHYEQPVADGRLLPALTSRAPEESLRAYRARIRSDLGRASTAIEAHTGRKPVAFAYPFGAYGAERSNDRAIRKVLREEIARRHTIAFHQDEQETIPLATSEDDQLGLRRLKVEDWSGPELVSRIAAAARRTDSATQDAEGTAEPPSILPLPLVGSIESPVLTATRPPTERGPTVPTVPSWIPTLPPVDAVVPVPTLTPLPRVTVPVPPPPINDPLTEIDDGRKEGPLGRTKSRAPKKSRGRPA